MDIIFLILLFSNIIVTGEPMCTALEWINTLKFLDLNLNYISDEAFVILADAILFNQLEHLDLSHCEGMVPGLLFSSEHTPKLSITEVAIICSFSAMLHSITNEEH